MKPYPPPPSASPPPPRPYYAQRPPVKKRRQLRVLGINCAPCLAGCLVLTIIVSCLCGGTSLFFVASPPAMTNILVVGVDAREGDSVELARTDSIMIVSLDPQRGQVSVMSIPRDVFVDTADFGVIPINTVTRNAELTTAGTGMATLITTIEDNFNIEIQHWIRFEFEGFVDVIDAVGGIDVDVPHRIEDYDFPTPDGGVELVIFEAGEQHMDGEIALKYARTRHADSDYNRTKRQQQVLQGIIAKLVSLRTIYRAPGVTSAILANSDTDMNTGHFIQYGPSLFLDARNDENIYFLTLNPDNYLMGDGYGHVIVDHDNPEFNDWLDAHLRAPAQPA